MRFFWIDTNFKTPQPSRKRKVDSFIAVSTPIDESIGKKHIKTGNTSSSTTPTVTGIRQSSRQRKTKKTQNNDFVYDVPSSGRDDFYDHHCKQCEAELQDDAKGTC